MYANLTKTIKEFDISYHKGRAKISDQEFDSLVRNLKRFDPNNSYFHQNNLWTSQQRSMRGLFIFKPIWESLSKIRTTKSSNFSGKNFCKYSIYKNKYYFKKAYNA